MIVDKRYTTWIALVAALAATCSVWGAEPKLFALVIFDAGTKDVSRNLTYNYMLIEAAIRSNVRPDFLSLEVVFDGGDQAALPMRPLTSEGVLHVVREWSRHAGRDDAVFVYIAGHGGFDKTPGKGAFLRFANDPGPPLLRRDLLSEVDKLDVRLKVVVTESCNTFDRIMTFRGIEHLRPLEIEQPYSSLFRSLFVESRGRLVLASSAPGEYSMIPPPADWNGNDPGLPSLFTGCLLEQLHNPERVAAWDEVVRGARSEVDRRFRLMFPDGYVDPERPFAPPQKTQTVTVKGGQFPACVPRPGGASRDLTRRLGFEAIYPIQILSGAVISEVDPDGVAVRAGLEPGDQVIRVNGALTIPGADPFRPVSGADALIDAVRRAGPGGRVYIEGIRARTGMPFAPFFAVLPATGPLAGHLGITVIGQPDSGQCLRIGAVRPGSSAASLGLGRGDVLTEVNGRPLIVVDNLEESLRRAVPGQAIVFRGAKAWSSQPFAVQATLPNPE